MPGLWSHLVFYALSKSTYGLLCIGSVVSHVKYYLNPTTSRLSLLLHESELRTSVNNNDNLRVQWDLSGFYPSALIIIQTDMSLCIITGAVIISYNKIC